MKIFFNYNKSTSTYYDVILSVIIGPIKYFVPIVGHFVLYPIMLKKSGIEIIGLWSLLTTMISYVGMTDIGFSLILTREAGKDRSIFELRELYKDYIVSKRFYITMGIVLLTFVFITSFIFFDSIETIYPAQAFVLSLLIIIIGTTLYLITKLDAAILSARNDNYYVQMISSITPILLFSTAIYGAWIGRPIEGYSFGFLLDSAVKNFSYRQRLRSQHKYWLSSLTTLAWKDTINQLFSLLRRGWHFYSISIGFVLREPGFRWILALLCGLETVGIYSIAKRLTMTARNLIASGFTVLYPSLAHLKRIKKIQEIRVLLKLSLLFLLAFGAWLIGTLIITADIILPLWLGEIHLELIISIQILGLWNMITIANLPFWYLLQSFGFERDASISLWLHTLCIFLLLPLSIIIHIGFVFALSYWLLSSILTQILIFYFVEKKLSLFWNIVLRPRICALIIIIAVYFFISCSISLSLFPLPISEGTISLALRILFIVIYTIVVLLILWVPFKNQLFQLRYSIKVQASN